MSIDLSRRLLDDGTAPTPTATAEHRAKAEQHARNIGGLFSDLKRPAPSGTHVLAGDPRIAVKADAIDHAAEERRQRLDAMLPAVRAKAGSLSMQHLAVLDHIARASQAAHGDPVQIDERDLARALRTDANTAATLVEQLVGAGVLHRNKGVWGTPRLLPTL